MAESWRSVAAANMCRNTAVAPGIVMTLVTSIVGLVASEILPQRGQGGHC